MQKSPVIRFPSPIANKIFIGELKCFINAIEYLVATLYNRVAWILNRMSVDLNGITLADTMIYIRFD